MQDFDETNCSRLLRANTRPTLCLACRCLCLSVSTLGYYIRLSVLKLWWSKLMDGAISFIFLQITKLNSYLMGLLIVGLCSTVCSIRLQRFKFPWAIYQFSIMTRLCFRVNMHPITNSIEARQPRQWLARAWLQHCQTWLYFPGEGSRPHENGLQVLAVNFIPAICKPIAVTLLTILQPSYAAASIKL